MTAAVLGGALGQYPLSLWSDHVDRSYVMAFAAFADTAIGMTIWYMSAGISTLQLMLLGAAWGAIAFTAGFHRPASLPWYPGPESISPAITGYLHPIASIVCKFPTFSNSGLGSEAAIAYSQV